MDRFKLPCINRRSIDSLTHALSKTRIFLSTIKTDRSSINKIGHDMTLAKDALDLNLNSAPQAPFSLVQLTEFYFSSHELNSARLSLV